MKLKKVLIVITTLFSFCLNPYIVMSNQAIENWFVEPWQAEGMISWGSSNVLVDFGPNGLWKYDGSWIRISHWDPKQMITWGESKLLVDFGRQGLYEYNGQSWVKISTSSQ